jgi:hypothetical protein
MDGKQKILTAFIAQHSELPVQGSVAWHSSRKGFFGGSEISAAIGQSPFKTQRGLVEDHLRITTFDGNAYTVWGTIMEGIVTSILERKWGTKIYETGSIPGAIAVQKYSPDGLLYLESSDMIILLEIKSAARRWSNKKVPKMYLPQIFTGLDSIRIADHAIFVDFVARRCSLADYKFNPVYDIDFHPKKKMPNPINLFCIYIYGENKSLYNLYGGLIDAGCCKVEDLTVILKGIVDKTYDYIVSDMASTDAEIDYKFPAHARPPLAILPVKIFAIDTTRVDRDEWKQDDEQCSYMQYHEPTLNRLMSIINELQPLTRSEQLEKLDQYFDPYKKLRPASSLSLDGMTLESIESMITQ